MPSGPGTYGSQVGRPSKKKKKSAKGKRNAKATTKKNKR